jgi:hypothetical protein
MYLLASEDAFNSQRGLKDLRRALPFLFFEKGRRRASGIAAYTPVFYVPTRVGRRV